MSARRLRRMAAGTGARRLKAVPVPFWFLLGGNFVNSFGLFVLPFLVTYSVRHGVPLALAGLTVTGYGTGAAASSLLGGELADRFGKRTTIVVSMVGSGAAMLVMAAVSGLVLLVALSALVGLFANLYRPAAGALVADLVGGDERVSAYAAFRLAMNLGTAVGPAVAGVLADRSYTLLFLGDAMTSLAFAGIAVLGLPEHRRAPGERGGDGETRGSVLRNVPFLVFLAGATLWWLPYYQSIVGLPLQVRALAYPNAAYGALLAVNGFMVVLLELPLTRLTRLVPRPPTIAIGALLIGGGFALVGIARPWWALAATIVVWTLGEMLVLPVASAYVMDLAPESLRGRYQGVWTFTFSLGMLAAPALGGSAFAFDPAVLWTGCAVAGIAAASLVLLSARLRTRSGGEASRDRELVKRS